MSLVMIIGLLFFAMRERGQECGKTESMWNETIGRLCTHAAPEIFKGFYARQAISLARILRLFERYYRGAFTRLRNHTLSIFDKSRILFFALSFRLDSLININFFNSSADITKSPQKNNKKFKITIFQLFIL